MFDPVTGRMLERPVVVIVGNKIASVASGSPPSMSGAMLVDLGDATLLPGFIDVHTHLNTTREAVVTKAWESFTSCCPNRREECTAHAACGLHYGA